LRGSAAHIGVTVKDGVVTLIRDIGGYAEKWALNARLVVCPASGPSRRNSQSVSLVMLSGKLELDAYLLEWAAQPHLETYQPGHERECIAPKTLQLFTIRRLKWIFRLFADPRRVYPSFLIRLV